MLLWAANWHYYGFFGGFLASLQNLIKLIKLYFTICWGDLWFLLPLHGGLQLGHSCFYLSGLLAYWALHLFIITWLRLAGFGVFTMADGLAFFLLKPLTANILLNV